MAPPPLVPVAPPASIPVSSMPPTSSVAPPNSLVNRTTRWVEENKYLVLGAAVVAAGGMGYYLYANQPRAVEPHAGRKEKSGESSSDEDVSRTNATGGATSQQKKKKKKSKSKKTGAGKTSSDQGPLLEERDPEEVKRLQETKRAEEPTATNTTDTPAKSNVTEDSERPSYLEGIPEKSQLSSQTAEVSRHTAGDFRVDRK